MSTWGLKKRPKNSMLLAQQVAQLLGAGLTLRTCLSLVTDSCACPHTRASLERQESCIAQGKRWSQSLKHDELVWPSLLIAWVTVGETTGQLSQALMVYCHNAQQSTQFKRAFIQSLVYPVMVLFASIVASVVMHVCFADSRQEPLGVLEISADMASQGLLMLGSMALILFIVMKKQLFASATSTEPSLNLRSVFPVRLMNWSCVFKSLSMLTQAGIPLIQAIESIGHGLIEDLSETSKQILQECASLLHSGVSFSQTLRYLAWPRTALSLADIAEQTGDVSQFFSQLTQIYEQAAHQSQQRLLTWCNPCVLLMAAMLLLWSYWTNLWPLYQSLGGNLP